MYSLTNETIADINAQFATVESLAKSTVATLRYGRLDWSDTPAVARSLKLLLTLRQQWLHLRYEYVKLCQWLQTESTSIKDDITYTTPNLRRESGGGFGNRYAESETTREAGEITPTFPASDSVLQVGAWIRQAEILGKECQSLYRQSVKECFDRLPTWSDIKRYCPKGGRQAYSALQACEIGKLDMNLASEHCLFGWHIGREDTIGKIVSNLRAIRKSIHPILERTGKAPSRKAGFDLLGSYLSVGKQDAMCKGEHRNAYCHSEFRRMVQSEYTIGESGNFNSTFTLYAHRQCDRVGLKTFQKIGVNRCSPGATITGRVERIGETDCFIVAASWVEHTRDRNGWQVNDRYTLISGYLLAKTGWDDCYHLAQEQYDKLQVLANGGDADRVSVPYQAAINAEMNRRSLSIPDINCLLVAATNQASQHHFDYVKRQREYTLSQLERDNLRKKRLARLLIALRKVERIELADSYAVGNCAPGTKQFCHRLGIQSESISGRELAARWRKSSWSDWERFVPVAIKVTGLDIYSIT